MNSVVPPDKGSQTHDNSSIPTLPDDRILDVLTSRAHRAVLLPAEQQAVADILTELRRRRDWAADTLQHARDYLIPADAVGDALQALDGIKPRDYARPAGRDW